MEQKQGVISIFMEFLLAITTFIESKRALTVRNPGKRPRRAPVRNEYPKPPSTHPVRTPPDPISEWLESASGALSQNTERALRADLEIYLAWCRHEGLKPWPTRAGDLVRFISTMARMKAPATVRRYVSSIVALHRAAGWKDPLANMTVRMAMQRMYRKQGRRQVQASGLTWPLRRRLLASSGNRLIDARNRALLAVAYDAMLRRSELVSLQVSDFSVEPDGSATLLVRRGKTDPLGEGSVLFLAPDTADFVMEWRRRGGIDKGFLFRSIGKNGIPGGALDSSQVPRIYKSMARNAGLGKDIVAGLSGHSTRVGAVQDMIASGIELPAILQAGRWKSTSMVNRLRPCFRYMRLRGAVAGPEGWCGAAGQAAEAGAEICLETGAGVRGGKRRMKGQNMSKKS